MAGMTQTAAGSRLWRLGASAARAARLAESFLRQAVAKASRRWAARRKGGLLQRLRRLPRQADLHLRPALPFDGTASSSRPFTIDFRLLERKGFIGRPFVRRRLARDMRAMRHRLLNRMRAYRLDDGKAQQGQDTIVMVTSCWPGEGKTFTAINLALSLVLEDSIDVLLVDGDVINPSFHHFFPIDNRVGLTELLQEPDAKLAPYLWRASNGRLTILPAGDAKNLPRSLLRGGMMQRFIRDVSSRYPERIVIFDTPPLLGGREGPVLANYADHILLTVECGRTSQSAVEDALDLLTTHENVSLVLNRCNEGDRLTSGAN
jgi:Mrp family chromosome partitioning ATPase